MDILDDTGVSKLSAKVFLKVNYSQKTKYLTILGLAIQGQGKLYYPTRGNSCGHYQKTKTITTCDVLDHYTI